MSGKPGPHQCIYCGKTCKTERGVTQHINWSQSCSEAQRLEVSNRKRQAEEPEPGAGVGSGSRRSVRIRIPKRTNPESEALSRETDSNDHTDQEAKNAIPEDEDHDSERREGNDDVGQWNNEEDDGEDEDEEDDAAINDATAARTGKPEPNTQLLEEFRAFCDEHQDKFLDLTKEEESSIKLMDILMRKKAPLNAFAEVLEWHLKGSDVIREHESLKDTDRYHHRNALGCSL